MARYNEGTIYTDEGCNGCNRCVAACPVMGANVTRLTDNMPRVEVSDKCIDCGLCLRQCNQGARKYRDDTDAFFADLQRGKAISIIVDPVLYIDYPSIASQVLGYLKRCGVRKIYDVSFGAEISMFLHAKYIREHMKPDGTCDKYLANNCSAILHYYEHKSPGMLDKFIPVQNPSMCTATYAHKYLNDDNRIACISPCVSEISAYRTIINSDNITYNVTIKHLLERISNELSQDCLAESDLKATYGMGDLVVFMSGFKNGVAHLFSRESSMVHYGGPSVDQFTRNDFDQNIWAEKKPLMISISCCQDGCVYGSGIDVKALRTEEAGLAYQRARKHAYSQLVEKHSGDEMYELISETFKDLNPEDFVQELREEYRQPYLVPEHTISQIMRNMYKDTPEKQHIDCRSCGYSSCKEMAVAVANGYAKMHSCIHYVNDDIKEKSFYDLQYDMLNTAGFVREANRWLDGNPDKDYYVAIGNINKLRVINELYGNHTGDAVIKHYGELLNRVVARRGIAARMGASTFAILLEDSPEVIDDFLKFKSLDCVHLGVDYPVTVHFGLCKVERNKGLDYAINVANFAAGRSKDRTQNEYIFFDDNMHEELNNEALITAQMQRALDDGEFVLFMQPQFDHTTGKIVGAEALSRWIKYDGSIVSPGIFIPVFEMNGFITKLDQKVWENGFKLVQKWETCGRKMVPISLNISRISLVSSNIVEIISDLDSKYQINRDHIHFEITESAYVNTEVNITEIIDRIRAMGYKVAMDDFGSGYSSLNSLKDIPIDILKLDMGFLRGGNNVERGKEIIAYMIGMAKALGFETVAEGVETKEQADFLTERGCDIIQGFYYSRPVPVEQYEQMIIESLGI